MNLIRACRGQLILTLLLLAAILVMPFQDYTERRLTAEDMNYPEASIGVVSEDGGILSIPGGAGHLVLSSDEYYLKKGTYEVTFSTVSDEEENTVEVFEPLYLNSDNTSGRILAQTQKSTHVQAKIRWLLALTGLHIPKLVDLMWDSICLFNKMN